MGASSEETIPSVAPDSNARSCIYVRNHINALHFLEFRSRGTKVRVTYICGESREQSPLPQYIFHTTWTNYYQLRNRETSSTTAAAGKSNSSLDVMQMHRNSNSINPREESNVEYLVSFNLNILNQGNEPTYVICNMKIINLTI
jgi:hypothetical protein